MLRHVDLPEIDLIEELRLRRWARENYRPAESREPSLHPLVLDEMTRKDSEVGDVTLAG